MAAGPPASDRPLVRARGSAVARDEAFCFYYEDNLDCLRRCGAELVEFSPIADAALPAGIDGIYFGGGYPELHAEALAANAPMRQAVAEFVARDGPVYAECGGFMYLTDAIVDSEGRDWPMAGIFHTRARMQKRLAKLGYIEVATCSGAGLASPPTRTRAGTNFDIPRSTRCRRTSDGLIRIPPRVTGRSADWEVMCTCTLKRLSCSENWPEAFRRRLRTAAHQERVFSTL